MMVRRLSLIWIGLIVAWAGVVFAYSRRMSWLDSVVDSSQGEASWSFPWDLFLWGAGGLALLCMVPFMLAPIWIVNQGRARRLFPDDDSAVILGVRNYHRSLASGGPLERVRGLGHISNVVVASSRGIELMGGVLRLKSRWESSWGDIEEIDQFTLTVKTHHVAGAGVSMRVKGFSIPLEFALVSARFPWADVAGDSEVKAAIDQLRALHVMTAR
jgi:hypothetical protein